jgi:hypothetical protein
MKICSTSREYEFKFFHKGTAPGMGLCIITDSVYFFKDETDPERSSIIGVALRRSELSNSHERLEALGK